MEDFAYLILAIVAEIPEAKVASYSQIARLAGYPKNARKVGKVMSQSEHYGLYPCFRVVHSDGRLVQGWDEQKQLLEAEGIVFTKKDYIDMKKYQWKEGQ